MLQGSQYYDPEKNFASVFEPICSKLLQHNAELSAIDVRAGKAYSSIGICYM